MASENKEKKAMFKKIMISVGLLAPVCVPLVHADDFSKLAFNIGGGVSTPLSPTSDFVGISGNFDTGAGYNIDKSNSVIGEFAWNGMPPNLTSLHPVGAPFGSINQYSLTANFRHKWDRLGGSPFGVYLIGGGGWYYRHASVDKNYVIPPATVCQPIYTFWGYTCTTGSFVDTVQIASKGTSAGGLDAGGGFTIRLSDSGWHFYVESRYNYAWSRIPSTFVPVTFGFRFN
jgi:Outer membrane protein beta-barrel domain